MTANRALRRAAAPNVFEAFRTLVYAHGVDRLAPLMGLKVGTLYNKADADDASHHQPTLRDVLLATQISGDMRVVDALCESLGSARFDCAQFETTSDEALLELLADLGTETGEFHRALAEGLRARSFTEQQLRSIRGEAFDIVSALMVLVRRLEDYVDEQPRPLA